MDLETFITSPRQWRWSGTAVANLPGDDCTTYPGSWVLAQIGVDPAADLRGTYASAEEAAAVVASEGGITALGDRRLGALGFRRCSDPRDGDIGVVIAISSIDLAAKAIPAIRFGPLWSIMGPRGAMTKKLEWAGVAWRRP